MRIAVTGATGFVGRELVSQLVADSHELNCWRRPESDVSPLSEYGDHIRWIEGKLGDRDSTQQLIEDCDAVIHSGLWRSSLLFQADETDPVEYARVNILGSLELIEAAVKANVNRFVFVSTCAVHDHILDDRPLDESHPLWANSHYGAHKAAIEKFVHSYGLGKGFPICAIRPTGVYGVHRPIERSKWFQLVRDVADGKSVEVKKGGKEVHVEDVAKAIRLLLDAEGVSGQAYSCYDRYISEYDVALMAKQVSGSDSEIVGHQKTPKHEIDSSKIKRLGMEFGGIRLLRETIEKMLNSV